MGDILEGRLPFAWLARLLALKVGDAAATIDGAWVSHAELDGESDLVVAMSGPKGRVVALIENKISALFQPEQGMRYRARAGRLGELGLRAVTILVAPLATTDEMAVSISKSPSAMKRSPLPPTVPATPDRYISEKL